MKESNRICNILITLGDNKEGKVPFGINRPLYQRCYGEAFQAIVRNIAYNRNEKEDRVKQESQLGGGNKDYVEPLDESNIITFIGSRGSGKTSALNEFCRLLRNYSRLQDREAYDSIFSRNKFGKGDYYFHVLMPIDASTLSKEEDLIEVILASMYQEVWRRQEKEKGRSAKETLYKTVLQEFSEVYKDYDGLKREESQSILGESVLVKLRDISSSLKTRKAFDKLTKDMLKYLRGDEGGEESYLVIVIDDLDMNPESGFDMLELLHKYLENMQVIILVAIKYEQMSLITRKHFIDGLVSKYGNIHIGVYEKFEKEAKDLSSDYLLKVLPLSNRIYLPESEELTKNGYVAYVDSPENRWDIKQFMLFKISETMGIFYDAKGLKRHFCTPGTIRQLVNYNSFLEALTSMEDIQKANEKERMKLYDQNHDRFNKDIEKRMAREILDDEQLERFQLIVERHINRRAEYAVNFIRQWTNSGKEIVRDEVDDQEYCYVNLLEALYKFGRANYENKPLIHCILASFTSEMTREYFAYLYGDQKSGSNSGKREDDNPRERLKCFLGKSFGGNWFGHKSLMDFQEGKKVRSEITDLRYEQNEERGRKNILAGYLLNVEMKNQKIKFKIDMGTDEQVADSLVRFAGYMECMFLFFSNFKDQSGRKVVPKYSYKSYRDVTEDGVSEGIEVCCSDCTATFDAFGFIGKAMEDENGDDLQDGIMREVESFVQEYLLKRRDKPLSERETVLLDKIKARMEQEIICQKIERKAVFPFYNLDLSYNIMKRVRKKIKENADMATMDVYNYYRTIYGYMVKYLREEEAYYKEAYNKAGKEERLVNFYDDFVNSFFIKTFGYNEEGKKAEDRNAAYNFFEDAITSIIPPASTIDMEIKNNEME